MKVGLGLEKRFGLDIRLGIKFGSNREENKGHLNRNCTGSKRKWLGQMVSAPGEMKSKGRVGTAVICECSRRKRFGLKRITV